MGPTAARLYLDPELFSKCWAMESCAVRQTSQLDTFDLSGYSRGESYNEYQARGCLPAVVALRGQGASLRSKQLSQSSGKLRARSLAGRVLAATLRSETLY